MPFVSRLHSDPKTVLVVSGGGFQGLSVQQALRFHRELRVVVVDCYEENVGRYFADAFFHVPSINDEGAFIEALLEICAKQRVSWVIPSTAHEIGALSRSRGRFAEIGVQLLVSSDQVLEIGADKLKFYDWLSEHNLPVLPYSPDPRCSSLTLPIFGKPRFGWGGVGCQSIRSADELESVSHRLSTGMVYQPLIADFNEVSVDFAINSQGAIGTPSLRRRVRTSGGFAVLCDPVRDARALDLVNRFINELSAAGAVGALNVQLIEAAGQYWFSDLNPRAGTSLPLSNLLGQDPLSILFETGGFNESKKRRIAFRYLQQQSIDKLDLENVKGLVVDLDDTLLDQKAWIREKLEMTWQAEKDLLPTRGEFLGTALMVLEEGNRTRLIDGICHVLGLSSDLRDRLISRYRQAAPESALLYSDARPFLIEMSLRGYALALLTDNPPESQRQKIDAAGLGRYFSSVLFAREFGCEKPHQDAFLEASKRLGLPPSSLVMVGDNVFRDCVGALDAGYKHAFQVRREGTFFNFSEDLPEVMGRSDSMTSIRSLREIAWYLEGVSASALGNHYQS